MAMEEGKLFFDRNPDIEDVDVFVVDVNGILRGKTVPRDGVDKMLKHGVQLPQSVFAFDVWGRDALEADLAAEAGDNDGVCRVVPGTLNRILWGERPVAQAMLSMWDARGKGFFADPRQVLARVLDLYKKEGLTPVVAAELEFYLLDKDLNEKLRPQPPISPHSGRRVEANNTLSMKEMDSFDKVLYEITESCRKQGVPADSVSKEMGPAQFEINLNHVPDALKAADHVTLMKRVTSGVCIKHGMAVTFMAKPYSDKAGSGMHYHFSILDKNGNNIFTGKDKKGSQKLKHAIGGLLRAMPDSIAILAPHANSYRRFCAGSHAPTRMAWGYDNRTAALRIPESDLAATRIEYRVAGADNNPYLALAVILAGALDGIKGKINPPAAIQGNVYETNAKQFPTTWENALDAFEKSRFIDKYLGKHYKKLYLACKRQEQAEITRQISSAELEAYLSL